MARVLSQAEIDVLLTALSGTEKSQVEPEDVEAYRETQKVVGVYDFRHPERLSRDQMRVLETVHQSFARDAGAFLSSRLMMLTEMTAIKVDQVTYAEFISSIPDPYCIYIFTLRTREEEEAILSFRPDLTFFIVDRVFGGQGRASESPREITAIEQNVMNRIVNSLLDHLTRAWHDICPLTPVSKVFHTNPSMVQIAPAGELMVVISFELKIHDFSSGISLCLPALFLEEVLPKQRQRLQAYQRANLKDIALMKSNLQEIDIPIIARLGEVRMSFRDLTDLRPGDIIRLDQKTEDEVPVLVGNKAKFYGLPGIIGDRKGIQIVRLASSEEETALSEEEKDETEP